MDENIQAVKRRFSIIGNSPKLNRAIYKAIQVSPTDISVLIEGESGVGKEVFSKIIHQLSRRKHEKFIAVNCGAIPEGTINSELFGHEKGSFTGATEKRNGYFETVDNGTIFLDEIGEMPLETQAYLLRVLESGEFIKVGSSKVQKTNVRIIAASNVNLLDRISSGRFREDLYYRLNTVSIRIPALKERKEDIPLLFRKFASDFADTYSTTPVQLDAAAVDLLKKNVWQGNIRQLKNTAEQISVLAPKKLVNGDEILDYLPQSTYRSFLPVALSGTASGDKEISEREILYKFLFDIKKDVAELREVVAGIVEQTGYEQSVRPDTNSISSLVNVSIEKPSEFPKEDRSLGETYISKPQTSYPKEVEIEDVEESLSIEEMEKRMIKAALKRHKGRRKEAALQLGISERTLYRKIKQYDLED